MVVNDRCFLAVVILAIVKVLEMLSLAFHAIQSNPHSLLAPDISSTSFCRRLRRLEPPIIDVAVTVPAE